MSAIDRALERHGYTTEDCDRARLIDELRKLEALVQDVVAAAAMDASGNQSGSDPWERAYDIIFSDRVSTRVFALSRILGHRLDYYDPDTSYEEDVRAFANALAEHVEELG